MVTLSKFFGLVAVFVSATGFAQVAPGPGVFRTSADAVWLSVVVTDEKGQAIQDLKEEEFTVQDQGSKQNLIGWHDGDAPVDLAIGVDNSASATHLWPFIKNSTKILLSKLRPRRNGRTADRATMYFLGGSGLVVGLRDNKEELIAALDSPEAAPGGNTTLFGRLGVAIQELNKAPPTPDDPIETRKKILVVLSDGFDTREGYRDSFVQTVHSTPVTIYTIRPVSKEQLDKEKHMNKDEKDNNKLWDLQAWKMMAPSTGGIAYDIPTDDRAKARIELDKAFSAIGDEFGKQYFMGFNPTNPRIGVQNWITVLLSRPGIRLNIRARKNYLIPDPKKL